MITSNILQLFPPYAVGVVVDAIRTGALEQTRLLQWLVLIALAGAAIYALNFLWRVLIFGSAIELGKLLRNRLFEHFTKMTPTFYQKKQTGDLMAHATNDIQAIETTAGEGILTLVDSLTMGGLVIMTMALAISWDLTAVALLPMPFMALATSRYGFMIHERFDRAQAAFSRLNNRVQESIAGIRVTKAFAEEESEKRSFSKQSKDVVEKNVAVARIDALFDPTINLIAALSFFLSVAYGSVKVVQGTLTLGELTAFTLYLGRLIWPLLAFGWLFNIVERGRASYDRVKQLLAYPPDVADRPGTSNRKPQGDLEYSVKAFAYPESEQTALTDVQFLLKQGQTLGITGKTGSGKSTLLRLLLREFNIKNGTIRIGGKNIEDYTPRALRSAIGYVPQDNFLFSLTIGENISFGKDEATREEVIQAAKQACIHEEILAFPQGYETVVGERGVTLSGGQKQRIAIARALLLNPDILILDDALSAVDGKTEEAILTHLRQSRKRKTTLIAAHRLSAIAHADWILVMDGGKIKEQGTHETLMQGATWYAEMYRVQQLESLVRRGDIDK